MCYYSQRQVTYYQFTKISSTKDQIPNPNQVFRKTATGDSNEGKVCFEFAITRKTSQRKTIWEAPTWILLSSFQSSQSHTKKAVSQLFNSNIKNRAENKIRVFFFFLIILINSYPLKLRDTLFLQLISLLPRVHRKSYNARHSDSCLIHMITSNQIFKK